MARLYRPHIPLEVRCRVAMADILKAGGNPFPHSRRDRESLAGFLARLLEVLAGLRKCTVQDLRLDHDPPLGARPQHRRGDETLYTPDANDPEHLAYRPHGAEFDGSHDVKTRIRGDHGQFSDIALIKRERRRERKLEDVKSGKKKRSVWHSGKTRWPKRPMRSKNSTKGTR